MIGSQLYAALLYTYTYTYTYLAQPVLLTWLTLCSDSQPFGRRVVRRCSCKTKKLVTRPAWTQH
jgi:hypothetical protein